MGVKKTTRMRYDSSITGDHVSLLINHPDLPDDEQLCEAILDDIEAAVTVSLPTTELRLMASTGRFTALRSGIY